jgi:hypothetical protein
MPEATVLLQVTIAWSVRLVLDRPDRRYEATHRDPTGDPEPPAEPEPPSV